MGWTARERHLCAKPGTVEGIRASAAKTAANPVPVTNGLCTAKNVFQLHAADAACQAVLRRKPSRGQAPRFCAVQARTLAGIEACGTGHYRVREIAAAGHEVKLLPPRRSARRSRGPACTLDTKAAGGADDAPLPRIAGRAAPRGRVAESGIVTATGDYATPNRHAPQEDALPRGGSLGASRRATNGPDAVDQ